jgi:two-component system response regulator HydG
MTTNSTIAKDTLARNVHGRARSAPEGLVKDQPSTEKPRPRVVVADDEASARSGLGTLLRDEGFDVVLTEDGASALAQVQESAPDILVTDLRMPGMDGIELLRRSREAQPELIVVLMTAFAEVETAVRAMQEGAEHYLTKPLQIDELVLVLRRALERRSLRSEATELRARLKENLHFDNIVGASPAMQEVFDVVEQVAPTKASVLITGESGTGKELVAQAIHENSPRAAAPFVKLHCASLAETLLESELFGHEKGSFTGAAGRREGGSSRPTVGRSSSTRSARSPPLSRSSCCASSRRGRSSGSAATRPSRSTYASSPRRTAILRPTWRAESSARTSTTASTSSTSRCRRSALGRAISCRWRRISCSASPRRTASGSTASPTTPSKRITGYRWPGNVRELENIIERAVVLCDGSKLTAKHLPAGVSAATRGGMRIPGSTMARSSATRS